MDPPGDAGSRDRAMADRATQDTARADQQTADATGDGAVLLDAPASDRGDGAPEDAAPEDGGQLDAMSSDRWDAAIDVAPASPTEVHVEVGRSVRLRFAATPGALWYQALHAWSPDGNFSPTGLASTHPEIVLTDLAVDATQWLAVVAHNGAGASPRSDAIEVHPRDGMPWTRAEIQGQVTRLGQPVEGAVVRLFRWLDHGSLWAETRSDASGRYRMQVPASRYLGLIAGFDQFPADGFAFERGYDDVGLYRPEAGGQARWIIIMPGELRSGADIAIDLEVLNRQISGQLQLGGGWPLGTVIVRACEVSSPACPFHLQGGAEGPYQLDVAPGTYRVEVYIDVDNNGQHGVNEPLATHTAEVDVSAGDATAIDLSLPAAAVIAGSFAGEGLWTVQAQELQSARPAIYSSALSDGQRYSLDVPQGRNYTVSLFVDQDGNGRRSLRDIDGDGRLQHASENFSESGWTVDRAVAAGRSDLDLTANFSRVISGRIEPAMQRWTVVARSPDGDPLFVIAAAPDGRFTLSVQANAAYLVYAYVDADGNARRSLVGEPAVALGELVDTSTADATDLVLTTRTVRGQLNTRRNDPAQGVYERVVVQQLVRGVGDGLLCPVAPVLNNIALLDAEGRFSTQIGALGSGAGSQTLDSCAPNCTGVVVTRFLDRDADLSPRAEGCTSAEALTYPQSPSSPSVAAEILDSSAGNVVAY